MLLNYPPIDDSNYSAITADSSTNSDYPDHYQSVEKSG